MRKSKQLGLTLIELMIALAVVAIIIGGVMTLASKVMTKAKVTNESKNVSAIIASVTSAFRQPYTAPNGFTGPNLATLEVVPSSMNTAVPPAAPVVTNSWGGSVAVEGVTAGAPNGSGVPSGGLASCTSGVPANAGGGFNGFMVTYCEVPTGAACVDIVQATADFAKEIHITGEIGVIKAVAAPRVNQANLLGTCSQAAPTVSISWYAL